MHKPTDSVRIALFDSNDLARFLGLTETDDPDNWKLVGGKFEGDTESPDDAAGRETLEEIGLTAEQVKLRAAATLTNDDGVSARYIFAGVVDPALVTPSDEIARIEWFTEATVPECKNRAHMLAAVAAARAVLDQPAN